MHKRRVIEDSDSENAAEASPQSQRAFETRKDLVDYHNEPQSLDNPQQSAVNSTGSTERLNREIRAAHQSLMEPTPNQSLLNSRPHSSSQKQSEASPTISRLKRTSTDVGGTKRSGSPEVYDRSQLKRARTEVGNSDGDHSLRKHGRDEYDIFEFRGGSDREDDTLPRAASRSTVSRQTRQEKEFQMTKALGTSISFEEDAEVINTWNKVNFVDINKPESLQSSMPPPTIKFHSSDQTPHLEANMRHMLSNRSSGACDQSRLRSTQDSKSSAFSEGRMPSPTISSHGQSDRGSSKGIDSTHGTRLMPGKGSEAINNGRDLTELNSSSSIDPSDGVRSANGTHHLVNSSPENGIVVNQEYGMTPGLDSADTINPADLPPKLSHDSDAADGSSFLPDTSRGKPSKNMIDRRRRPSNQGLDIELDSDDAAIGLPKDQYQPRPSKSRSGQGIQDVIIPADYSKRSEATAKRKRKRKRAKTTAFQELLPKDDEDDEEDDNQDIAKQPSLEISEIPSRKSSIERNQPELKEPEEVEKTHADPSGDPSLLAKSTGSKKQRGRPKKQVIQTHEDDLNRPPEASDIILSPHESRPEDPVASVAVKKAKKGRPVKQASTVISEEVIHDSDDDDDANGTNEAEDGKDTAASRVLKEIPGNCVGTILSANSGAKSPSPLRTVHLPPKTPQKDSTPAPQKGPTKHSPLSGGKVAYRVGLSKRQRIAPLLRIVRK